jgi:malate/lactate dehydrogenase
MAIVIISLGLNQASYLSRLDEEEKLASFIIHSLEHIQTYTHTHKACLLFL